MEELKALIELAKAHGLKRIKLNTAEIEFFREFPSEPTQEPQFKPAPTIPLDQMPTDDDLLYWSSNGPLPSDVRKLEQES